MLENKKGKRKVNKEESLQEAYERVFNYDPTEEEVEAKYDDEFNEWLDNFLKK